MTTRKALTWLVPVIGLLAILASAVGLWLPGGEGPRTFTTVHGQTVELYGYGLYQKDTLFFAATFKGLDVVTLAVFVPALALAYWLYRRGSARGAVLLASVLSIFLYNGASMAFGAAYSPMFLVYVALLGSSFVAFVLAFAGLDHARMASQVGQRLPRRGLAIFLIIAGLAPLGLWLSDILGTLAQGGVPELLGSYTTAYTYAVDLAIVVPAVYWAAYLVLRRAPAGYALSLVMLVLLVSVGVGVIAATTAQYLVGIVFPLGAFIGLILSWVVLGALAVAFVVRLVRALPDHPLGGAAHADHRRQRRPAAARAGTRAKT